MTDYGIDLHAWALEQADAIGRGELKRIDRPHVADEIRDVARACERELYDALVELARLVARGLSVDPGGVKRRLDESPSMRDRLPALIVESVNHALTLPEERTLNAEQTRYAMHAMLI